MKCHQFGSINGDHAFAIYFQVYFQSIITPPRNDCNDNQIPFLLNGISKSIYMERLLEHERPESLSEVKFLYRTMVEKGLICERNCPIDFYREHVVVYPHLAKDKGAFLKKLKSVINYQELDIAIDRSCDQE